MKNETFSSKNKLVYGFIKLAIAVFFLFNFTENDLRHAQKWMAEKGSVIMPYDLASFLATCVFLVVVWKLIKFFVVGLLQVLTHKQRLAIMGERPVYGVWHSWLHSNSSSTPNIDRALSYRESAMAGMNSADAADYLNSTSRLDAYKNSNQYGSNTQRAASFVESRMAGLNDADKISYIQGKIK
jgi:hypothetical protein